MFKSNIILIMILIGALSGAELSSIPLYSTPSSINSTSTTIENEETIAFNRDLKLYIGNNLQASQVITLINMIKTSNANNPDKQITLSLNSETYSTQDEFLEAINDISTSDTFTIYFEYSPSGFINKSIISKNIQITPSNPPSSSPIPLVSSNPSSVPTTSSDPNSNSTSVPTDVSSSTPTPTSTPTATPISGNVSTTVTF